MNIRSLLISTLVLATVSLTSALVFAQPKTVEPPFSEEAVRKVVLETNAKVSAALFKMVSSSLREQLKPHR